MGSIAAALAGIAATARQCRSETVRRVAGVAVARCCRWPRAVVLPRRRAGPALRIAASGELLELGPVAARAGAVAGAAGLPDAAHVDLQGAPLARHGLVR